MASSDSAQDTAVRPPQQARSRRTLERLTNAALDLVDRDGPDGVTVAAVVARAKSSVGSFYARFPGKDELFVHLAETLREEALEQWRELDLFAARDAVSATVDFLLQDEATDGARRRALLDRSDPASDSGAFTRAVAQDLHEALQAADADAPSEETVTLAIRMARASLAAVLSSHGSVAADGSASMKAEALRPVVEGVVRVILALGAPSQEERDVEISAPVPDDLREPVDAPVAQTLDDGVGPPAVEVEALPRSGESVPGGSPDSGSEVTGGPEEEVEESESASENENPESNMVDPFEVWG